ncbi:MAG: glycerate kinase [Pseudomonadota bacterium]
MSSTSPCVPRAPRILIAPDSFKGSLNAIEAAACMARGVARALAGCSITQLPMADGGEGSAEVVASALAGEGASLEVTDANGEPRVVSYAICRNSAIGRFAILDAAAVVGLPQARVAPPLRTTRGIGEAIRQLYEGGERTIVLGLGGTSTMEAGSGLLAEVALDFHDAQGRTFAPTFASLEEIVRVERRLDSHWLQEVRLIALTDVVSPLTGAQGASFIFGAQKGFSDLQQADQRLAGFASRCQVLFGCGFNERPGAGAAGGLGYALALLGAELRPGADFIAATLSLQERMADYDWVITGEGCSDRQTLLGKGPAYIAALAREHGVPVALLSGAIKDPHALAPFFDGCFSSMPHPDSLDFAMAHAASLLEEASAQLATLYAAVRRHVPTQ